MKVLCYSVRLESLTDISEKCLKAVAFDGSEALIPSSQYYGQDYNVTKSEAHWISAWILEKKSLQYSTKKEAWFNSESRKMVPHFVITKKTPEKVNFTESKPIEEWKR
jgi:hypothetical protein